MPQRCSGCWTFLHRCALPGSVTVLFHDLKFTLGYPRYAILLACFLARCAQLGSLDTSSEMVAALTVGAFMFLEEVLEDIIVLMIHWRCEVLLPDWSSMGTYATFHSEHPS